MKAVQVLMMQNNVLSNHPNSNVYRSVQICFIFYMQSFCLQFDKNCSRQIEIDVLSNFDWQFGIAMPIIHQSQQEICLLQPHSCFLLGLVSLFLLRAGNNGSPQESLCMQNCCYHVFKSISCFCFRTLEFVEFLLFPSKG